MIFNGSPNHHYPSIIIHACANAFVINPCFWKFSQKLSYVACLECVKEKGFNTMINQVRSASTIFVKPSVLNLQSIRAKNFLHWGVEL